MTSKQGKIFSIIIMWVAGMLLGHAFITSMLTFAFSVLGVVVFLLGINYWRASNLDKEVDKSKGFARIFSPLIVVPTIMFMLGITLAALLVVK